MSADMLELANDDVEVTVDPGRGADVLTLVDRDSGCDVLFRSPWRARADAIRGGQRPSTHHPVAGWLEQYRGGWQTLCPNGGPPRDVHGAPVGFHGEASAVPWVTDRATTERGDLHVELFSVPVRISRVLELQGAGVRITDTLTNLGRSPLELDYSSHPALGGGLLDGECRLETGARRFTADPDSEATPLEPGSEHTWPLARDREGAPVDLRVLPAPGTAREIFGWLDDFLAPWATVTNPEIGLTVRLDWDGERLPFAWLWQELNATAQFPWYGRARAVAVEPASMQTSGPSRRSVMGLRPGEDVSVWIRCGLDKRGS